MEANPVPLAAAVFSAALLGFATGARPPCARAMSMAGGGGGGGSISVTDGGGNTYLATNAWNGRDSDIRVFKYSPSGQAWDRTYDAGASETAYGAAVDADGNLYVVGATEVPGNSDFLILKYSPEGRLLAAKQYDQSPRDAAVMAAASGREWLAVAGSASNGSAFAVWVARLNPQLDVVWQQLYDAGRNCYIRDLHVNPRGDVEVTYETPSPMPGGYALGLQTLRFDANGNRYP